MSRLGSVLVTGASGQLGSDLGLLLADRCELALPSHGELDVADPEALSRAFEEHSPTVLINCAAFHNVEECERRAERSFEVNAGAVQNMAELCAQHETRLVHLSTNYVFDGARDFAYAERDVPSPQSVYAISKLAGEHMALAYAPQALVVRAAGLYGIHGSASKGGNFVTRMLARAREQGALTVVADQRLSPTFTADLASALVEAIEAEAEGIVHLTASESCSWHEFTVAIMELAGLDSVTVAPATTERPPGAARRPLNGVLARPRADALGLTPLRSWRAGLEAYMSRAGLRAATNA